MNLIIIKKAAVEFKLGSYYRVFKQINELFIKIKNIGKLIELLFTQNPLFKGKIKKKVVLINLNTNTYLFLPSFKYLFK